MGLRFIASTVLAALAMVVVPGAAGVDAAEPSTVEVRDLSLDVDRDLGSQFGGRADVTVRFRVANTGDARVDPTARIKVESQIGGGAISPPMALPSLGAGEHVDVVRTAGSLLPFGSAHVTVTVRADGQVASATASTPVIPWFLLLVVALVVLVGVACWRARRRTA